MSRSAVLASKWMVDGGLGICKLTLLGLFIGAFVFAPVVLYAGQRISVGSDFSQSSRTVTADQSGSDSDDYYITVPPGKRAHVTVRRQNLSSECVSATYVRAIFGGTKETLSSNGSSVNFILDKDGEVDVYVSCDPSTHRVEYYMYNPVSGYYDIRYFRDVEWDYYSSTLTYSIDITYEDLLPDLAVSSLSLTPSGLTMCDDEVTVMYAVENIGGLPAERFNIGIVVDGTRTDSFRVDTLLGGKKISRTVSLGRLQAGVHVLKVTADVGGAVRESSESNNEKTKSIAVYDQKTYTVRFDRNGGSGTMSEQSMDIERAIPLLKCQYRRDGFNFIGWAVTPEGSVAYKDGVTVGNLTKPGCHEVVLYAVWEKQVTYVVHFETLSGSGTGTMPDQVFTNGVQQKLQANAFRHDKFAFAGWYIQDIGLKCWDEAVVNNLDGWESGEVTLSAVWGRELDYKGEVPLGGEGLRFLVQAEIYDPITVKGWCDLDEKYHTWREVEEHYPRRERLYDGFYSSAGSWVNTVVNGSGRLYFYVQGLDTIVEKNMGVSVDGKYVPVKWSWCRTISGRDNEYCISVGISQSQNDTHLVHISSATFEFYGFRWCPDRLVFPASGCNTNVWGASGLVSDSPWLSLAAVGVDESAEAVFSTTWKFTADPNDSIFDRVGYAYVPGETGSSTVMVVQTGLPHEEVTFDTQDGQKSVVRFAKGAVYGELPVPQSVDRVFDGWYTSPSGGRLVTVTDHVVSGILYAHWKIAMPGNAYAVLFDGNTGAGIMSAKVCESGKIYALTKCSFTPPAGKRFAGWACSNGRRYDDGMLVFDLAKPGETVTMTAIWE